MWRRWSFFFLWLARSLVHTFVALALLPFFFCYCCCWFCCILFVSFCLRLTSRLKLMKNLLRSFIHFIMNNSYQIKHLAWCIHGVCRRLQFISCCMFIPLVLRRSTNYPPPTKPFSIQMLYCTVEILSVLVNKSAESSDSTMMVVVVVVGVIMEAVVVVVVL